MSASGTCDQAGENAAPSVAGRHAADTFALLVPAYDAHEVLSFGATVSSVESACLVFGVWISFCEIVRTMDGLDGWMDGHTLTKKDVEVVGTMVLLSTDMVASAGATNPP